jgi:negative regulator of sigma E activity
MVSERLQQALSALADGRATAQEWAEIEAAWAHQPELRAQWAEIAWIGDGLRSQDLLRQRVSDETLQAALRAAPQSTPNAGPRARRDWWAPAAAVAGLALVAWLVPGLRGEAPVVIAAAPATTSPLAGESFAQAVAAPSYGRNPGAWSHLPAAGGVREASLGVAPAPVFPWDLAVTPPWVPSLPASDPASGPAVRR